MVLLAVLAFALLPVSARDLQLYFIDVEGGQATLIVSPSGQTLLVDTGWPGPRNHGADRILKVAEAAGVKRIDYLLVTHYHLDHVGGVPELAAKLPIGTFIDHGSAVEHDPMTTKLVAAYEPVREKGKHLLAKPGERIPLEGLDVVIVTSGGERIVKPLEGAGAPNPACEGVLQLAPDPTENAQSIGFMLRYGKFRFADLGDLTWNKEMALVCPKNMIGHADLYLVTHHGMDISNSPCILAAISPKAAIMNNGARKGGAPKAFAVIEHSPGFQDLWQLHTALGAGGANVAEQRIANPAQGEDEGHWIQVTARKDGSFIITNTRNGFNKTY